MRDRRALPPGCHRPYLLLGSPAYLPSSCRHLDLPHLFFLLLFSYVWNTCLGDLLVLAYFSHSKKRVCSLSSLFFRPFSRACILFCVFTRLAGTTSQRRSLSKLCRRSMAQTLFCSPAPPPCMWAGGGEVGRNKADGGHCPTFLFSAIPGCQTNPSKTFT